MPTREVASRAWLGVLALAAGAYLAGDAVHRLGLAWQFLRAWWPWALAALAALNLLRSVAKPGSLLAPGLLALAALIGFAVQGTIAVPAVTDLVIPAALVLGGATLLLRRDRPDRQSWTSVLATRRGLHAPARPAGALTVRAIVGELRIDLNLVETDTTVHATAIFGRVVVTVPVDWVVRVHGEAAVLTCVPDLLAVPRGADPDEQCILELHVLGFCAAVEVRRACG